MRIALAQINPTVGDLTGNARTIRKFIADAASIPGGAANLVAFPELCLCGYPPKDLLLQSGFVSACEREAIEIGRELPPGLTVVLGLPMMSPDGTMTNSLLVMSAGRTPARYDKRLLPTYDVFDEDRYFTPGERAVVVDVATTRGPVKVGLSICEDLWKGEDAGFASRYAERADPVPELISAGARVIVNPSASPFVLGKGVRHRDLLRRHATRHGVFVAAVNQVGGNDDLVFDGHAAVFDPAGTLVAAAPGFEEHLLVADVPLHGSDGRAAPAADPAVTMQDEELAFFALRLGVRDYLKKCGFSRAILGLSGGIDSALTAAIAAGAIGAENVLGVAMPGPYSSEHALRDAREVARRLGIGFTVMPIRESFAAASNELNGCFGGQGLPGLGVAMPDVAEENLQSRLRGTLLMGLSNRSGAIVLTTGNKSELAVGYCTLYGDMNGGLAVLSDLTKQLVYRISKWLNARHDRAGFAAPPIPEGSIEKPPSAELRPNQTDQDSLPPYDDLDAIVARYVEGHESPGEIVSATGLADATVRRVCRLIDLSEYKRKQAAIGLKVTRVAFGSGRRFPVAQRWRPWA